MRNPSEQTRKICVRNKSCPRGQTGKHLCRQQCVLVYQGLYLKLAFVRHIWLHTR